MACTFDFSTLSDSELLYGFQRVNSSRFPQNFEACKAEILRRGLELPERSETCALFGEGTFFHRITQSLSSLAHSFGRATPQR